MKPAFADLRTSLVASVAVLLASALSGTAALAQLDVCQNGNEAAAKRIAACSKVIGDTSQSIEARADALSARGSVTDDGGDHKKAIEDFTEALKLVPNDPATLILRGNAYDSIGEKQKAIADYSESIRVYPQDAAAWYNRGSVYQELGDAKKALADYKKALEIDPDFDSAKQGLAELADKK